MIGDVVLGGVYFPALLLLGLAALVLTALVSWLFNLAGVYRLFAYRPLADIALFVLLLGGLVLVTTGLGTSA